MEKKALHIGIDFSLKRADVGLFGPHGEYIIDHRAFSNSRTGYEEFRELVMNTIAAHGFESIFVSGEATSNYWKPFFQALTEDKDLIALGLHQYLLNPRWVRWFKKSFAPDHKTDQRDPYYIAERTRANCPSYEWKSNKTWDGLRFLTRLRFHLSQDLTREKNFFQAYLFLFNNAYTQYKPFSDIFSETSRQIIAQMDDLDWISTADADEVADYLDGVSGRHLDNHLENARLLQKAVSERFTVDTKLASVLQHVLNLILDHILFIAKQIKQVDLWIATEASNHPEIQLLQSIPGIGPVFASGIAAELGDLNRFFQGQKWDPGRKCYRSRDLRDVDAAIAKIAGLWWPRSASGNFEAEDRHLAKSGNRYLRYYLIQAADHLRQHVPAYSAFYNTKFFEVNKHRHKRALVLTARKSIRLYVGLLHRNEPFRSGEAQH